MAVALWFLVGLVGGLLSAVFSGRLRTSFFDILASLAGSFLGGFLFQRFLQGVDDAFSSWSLIAAAVGSISGLIVLERHRRRRESGPG